MKSGTRGFTLIELLVVIAIIGILSSVVLASLNTARDKGTDAAIKSNLSGVRAQAELHYDSNPSTGYQNLFTTGQALQAIDAVETLSTDVNATSSLAHWQASALLKSSALYYCVDSTGKATTTSSDPGNGMCP